VGFATSATKNQTIFNASSILHLAAWRKPALRIADFSRLAKRSGKCLLSNFLCAKFRENWHFTLMIYA